MQAKTIDEVISFLDEIVEENKKDQSPLGYFPALYRLVTKTVRKRIEEDYFDNGPRMEHLDVVFANRYLEAYHAYKNQRPCTFSWLLAFEAASKSRLIVIQHLFTGMNAHINLDLGIAAAKVAGHQPIEELKGDFMKINEILSSLVSKVQTDLAEIWPFFRMLDAIGGRFDEALADFSMDIARDEAWNVACTLAEMKKNDQRDKYIIELDKKVSLFGEKVVRPGRFLRFILFIIRLGERGEVAKKISYLE